jgi:formylmethanofuran dehydrogenase subunit B
MNALTRFVCMPLGGGGNLAGVLNVLAWGAGYPSAVSLARGYPRHSPGEFNATELLRTGEVDAALIVSGDPSSRLSREARDHLGRIPRIVLGSDSPIATGDPTVFVRTATFGISTPGTVYRMDGVPLPLREVLASSFPSDRAVLRAIEHRVRSLGASDTDLEREGDRWR